MDYKIKDQKTSFTTQDAVKFSGLSPYMVDYLCQTGIVTPSAQGSFGRGRGKGRRYTGSDIMLLYVLDKLLKQGVSVKRLKDSFKNWKREFSKSIQLGKPDTFLIANGEKVILKTKENFIVDIEDGAQYAFSFIIDLKKIYETLEADIFTPKSKTASQSPETQ